jgi:hypothetical protein
MLPQFEIPGERYLSLVDAPTAMIRDNFWHYYTSEVPDFAPCTRRGRRVFLIHVTLEELLGD